MPACMSQQDEQELRRLGDLANRAYEDWERAKEADRPQAVLEMLHDKFKAATNAYDRFRREYFRDESP